MRKNPNGSYSPMQPIDLKNPQVSKKEDWWEKLCQEHGTENHWKKEPKKNENTKEQ
jgi:hypothetical protein